MSDETRKAEAQGKIGTVEWRGNTFEVPLAYDDWSVDFTESLEEGKSVGIVRGALGPSQWRTVREMNLKNRDLGELAARIAAAMGFGSVPESPASVD